MGCRGIADPARRAAVVAHLIGVASAIFRAPALIAANGLPPVAPGEMISIMGIRCVVDPNVPKGSVELRDANGRLLKRIVNLGEG